MIVKKNKIRNLTLSLFIFFMTYSSIIKATNWYVDNAATGNSSGVDWQNAWSPAAPGLQLA